MSAVKTKYVTPKGSLRLTEKELRGLLFGIGLARADLESMAADEMGSRPDGQTSLLAAAERAFDKIERWSA